MDKVSVCFITYNRLHTLVPTYTGFLNNTDYPREALELIVCDDGSPTSVREEIKKMDFDKYIFNERRKGLGNNQNNGIKAATNDFILQIQDDWVCEQKSDYLRNAISTLKTFDYIGMIFFWSRTIDRPQIRETLKTHNGTVTVYDNLPQNPITKTGQGSYSDRPHIKRRQFHDTLGLYKEDIPMWDMELEFSRRVNAQTQFFIGEIEGYDKFRNIGEDCSFNRGNLNSRIARRLSTTTIGALTLKTYYKLRG